MYCFCFGYILSGFSSYAGRWWLLLGVACAYLPGANLKKNVPLLLGGMALGLVKTDFFVVEPHAIVSTDGRLMASSLLGRATWRAWYDSIIFGRGSGLSSEIVEAFKVFGLLHLLVVSGSHFSFVALLLNAAIKWPFQILYGMRLISPVFWRTIEPLLICVNLIVAFFLPKYQGFNLPASERCFPYLWSQWDQNAHLCFTLRRFLWLLYRCIPSLFRPTEIIEARG